MVLCEMRTLPGLCGSVKNMNGKFTNSQFSKEDFGDGIVRPLCDFMAKRFDRTYPQPKPRNANNPHVTQHSQMVVVMNTYGELVCVTGNEDCWYRVKRNSARSVVVHHG